MPTRRRVHSVKVSNLWLAACLVTMPLSIALLAVAGSMVYLAASIPQPEPERQNIPPARYAEKAEQ